MNNYKDGILKPGDTGIPTRFLSGHKPENKSTKGENLLKITKNRVYANRASHTREKREEDPPRHPTPRRVAPEGAGKEFRRL